MTRPTIIEAECLICGGGLVQHDQVDAPEALNGSVTRLSAEVSCTECFALFTLHVSIAQRRAA